jgi:glycosyltransferase involved in cell wall biosynthesis
MPHNILQLLGSAENENTAISSIVGLLAKGLDPARYRVHAWFLGTDGPLVSELRKAGVLVRHIDWRFGVRDPAGVWRFLSALNTANFSIVHQHFGGLSPRWLVRAKTRAKIITHVHGYINESRGTLSAQAPIQGADLVIAISHAVAKQVVGAQTRVIYTGVVPPRRSAPGKVKNGRVLGTACRLVAIKGIIHLIRAMALLRGEFPELRLEIAGEGPDRPMLEMEVHALGLNDQITFLGWRPDISLVMLGWDIFVMPSLAEGLGIAVLEAMAHGLPVVGSAVGGLREVVVDGETGLLLAPADPQALAQQLSTLLRNPEKRCAMEAAALNRVNEHFSATRMVTEISNVYDEMLAFSHASQREKS